MISFERRHRLSENKEIKSRRIWHCKLRIPRLSVHHKRSVGHPRRDIHLPPGLLPGSLLPGDLLDVGRLQSHRKVPHVQMHLLGRYLRDHACAKINGVPGELIY